MKFDVGHPTGYCPDDQYHGEALLSFRDAVYHDIDRNLWHLSQMEENQITLPTEVNGFLNSRANGGNDLDFSRKWKIKDYFDDLVRKLPRAVDHIENEDLRQLEYRKLQRDMAESSRGHQHLVQCAGREPRISEPVEEQARTDRLLLGNPEPDPRLGSATGRGGARRDELGARDLEGGGISDPDTAG